MGWHLGGVHAAGGGRFGLSLPVGGSGDYPPSRQCCVVVMSSGGVHGIKSSVELWALF